MWSLQINYNKIKEYQKQKGMNGEDFNCMHLNNLGLVREDFFINYDIVYYYYVGHRRENTEYIYIYPFSPFYIFSCLYKRIKSRLTICM